MRRVYLIQSLLTGKFWDDNTETYRKYIYAEEYTSVKEAERAIVDSNLTNCTIITVYNP